MQRQRRRRRIRAASSTLVVATLNLAHGRKDSFNQVLVSTRKTRENLAELSAYVRRGEVDVLAVQEADAPSSWSGNFDHVGFIAEQAEYPWFIHAVHSSIGIAEYGTGILSRRPIRQGLGLTFPPSPPTVQKGFTLAEVAWQVSGSEEVIGIDVLSVHLDFSRRSVREQQIEELKAVLNGRSNPMVIMGDFNSESIARDLRQPNPEDDRYLHGWFDEEQDLTTYKDKRLDWILLSNELTFVRYQVGREILSDHRPVVAEIKLEAHSMGPGD